MWIPQSTNTARRGNRIRIHAGPRFVRPDGRTWRPIADAVTKTALPDGGYELRYGEKWIRLRPASRDAAALAAATKRTVMGTRHFGPLLDASRAPDALQWCVTASPGVTRVPDAWILGAPDGVKCGLFLRDWRAVLGPACHVRGDTITLDLTAAKQQGREIDLDPTLTAAGETGLRYEMDEFGWLACRNVGTHGYVAVWAQASYDSGLPEYACCRGYIQFDTSDLGGSIAAATLTLTPTAINDDAGSSSIITKTIDAYTTLAAAPADPTVKHTIDTVTVSALSVGVAHAVELSEAELADIDTEGKTCFHVVHSRDMVFPAPTAMSYVKFDDEPTLEITLAGGRSPLTPVPSTYNSGI